MIGIYLFKPVHIVYGKREYIIHGIEINKRGQKLAVATCGVYDFEVTNEKTRMTLAKLAGVA